MAAMVVGSVFLCGTAARAADTISTGSVTSQNVKQVAPGIWRIRLGQPETFTPLHFQTVPPDEAGLKALPAAPMPFDAGKIHFQITGRGIAVELPMERGESIYGFGLNTELFDLTRTEKGGGGGRRVFLKPTDHPENDLGESHAPVPFFVSTRGYGVFVDTARYASFYTGNVKTAAGGAAPMLIDVPSASGVDVYVFAGPEMLDAVRRYNLFSGGGCVPPLWGLGMAYRGNVKFSAAESLALAAQLRADHLPFDIWGLEPGWQTKSYPCSFVWNTNLFPDPDEFIRKMHRLGYRLNFWEHAYTSPSSPIYAEIKPWSGNFLVFGGLVPDFATPQARRIFLEQNEAVLFSKGADAVKLDECDNQPDSAAPWAFPEASVFPSGLDGELMHSLFGVLYQRTMLEPFQKRGLRTWGLVRDSGALAAPLPYTVYSDSYDHRCYVRGLANEGFSGLLWCPEVRQVSSVEDLYRRVETAIFSPFAQIDCWNLQNPPWVQIEKAKNHRGELMPDHETVMNNFRRLLQLRMELAPYLYSAFNVYHRAGTPPIRALVLDWPRDPKVREIDDQFMFGPSLLVAPMFTGETNRPVYLPQGDWYDFWTHQKYRGGQTITATNGWQQIPLFVRGETLLPLAEPVESIATNTCFAITVEIFGGHPADFTLYEDDGVSAAFMSGDQNQLKLHWTQAGGSVERTGNYTGPARYKIVNWQPVTAAEGQPPQ